MKKLYSISFLLCFLTQAAAQPPRQYTFTHYSTATGLQSNQINSVVQDETGYIWLATTEGLVRFDGTRQKNFRHNDKDSTTICSNALLQLIIDDKQNLWILFANGRAGIFNTKNFRFKEVSVKPRNEAALKAVFKRLSKDEYGNIFLLLVGHDILKWDESDKSFTVISNFFPVKAEWEYSGFAQQPGTQKYWFGIQGGGLAIYNRANGHLSYPGNNMDNEPAIDALGKLPSVQNFLFDKKSRFWFVSWTTEFPYVYCYHLKESNVPMEKYEFFSTFKTYTEINGIFEQADGTIWIRGLVVFGRYIENEKRFELVHAGYENERSIDYRIITCLYEDREKNIWVGTGINGVFRFNPSQEFFSNIMHINRVSGANGDGSPRSFFREKDGSLLVGIWQDGIYRYDKKFNTLPVGIKGIPEKNGITVWDMYATPDSSAVWFASQNSLYKYNTQLREATVYTSKNLNDKYIKQLAVDNTGNLWLGMSSTGLYKWNETKGKKNFDAGLAKFEAIPNTSVNSIIVDEKGFVWVATGSDGLYVIDPVADSIVMHFNKNARGQLNLPEENVTDLLPYNDSLIVLSTPAHLFLYNKLTQKKKELGTTETTSGNISSLQKDNNGNLWIGTTVALYRATIKTRVFVRFNRDDGITNDFFIPSSSYKLPDGRLIFGASGQFVVFNPAHVLISTQEPNISITDFKVMNKSLPVDSLLQLKQIELGYEDNSLSIDFSLLSYISAHIIQYKLDGIDKDWKTADKTNQAIYSYLPGGHYELQFKTIDSDGKIKLSSLKLAIDIRPPFWKTWWFYGLLLLLAGGILFWLDKTRMKRKEVLLKMRSNIAGNLHEDINTALNNINILSEMARMKADKDPEKSKEFIEQIHNKSHRMIIAMDDMLWSISPDNDSMEKTVARMQEYIDSMNNRRSTNNKLLVDEKVKLLNLDMQFRHEAFLLFKECIGGLLHAGVTMYKMNVLLDRSVLLYSIDFNSENCEKQELTNMQDKLIVSRHATAINAHINLQVQKKSSVLEIKMMLA
ncbi:MAG: two-component regulator propeller domain-containing protein [Chitinophagaceae bacterium]